MLFFFFLHFKQFLRKFAIRKADRTWYLLSDYKRFTQTVHSTFLCFSSCTEYFLFLLFVVVVVVSCLLLKPSGARKLLQSQNGQNWKEHGLWHKVAACTDPVSAVHDRKDFTECGIVHRTI